MLKITAKFQFSGTEKGWFLTFWSTFDENIKFTSISIWLKNQQSMDEDVKVDEKIKVDENLKIDEKI